VAKKKPGNSFKLSRFAYDASKKIIKNLSVASDTKISIYSLKGCKVILRSGGRGIWKLPENISNGIYFLKVDKFESWNQKITIK